MPTRSTPVAGALFAALLILSAQPVLAATTVPPGNITTQTWSPDGNPYVVTGDITIPAAAILTIQAGTVVLFTSTDASGGGLSVGQVELTVAGQLRVQGSWSSPVTFEAQSGSQVDTWYGIVVDTTGVASIQGAIIAETHVGISSAALSASGALLAVSQTLVLNSFMGMLVADGVIAEVRISGTTGVGLSISGSGSITNTIVDHCASGIRNENATSNAALTIESSTIDSNSGGGVLVDGVSSFPVSLFNNLITNNGQFGIERGATTSVTSTYSDVWNNGSNYLDVTAGAGSVSANPLYASTTDYHLQAGSPAINAGTDVGAPGVDFDLNPRPQGGLFDIGAYEYAGGTDAGTSTGGAGGGAAGGSGGAGPAGTGGAAGSSGRGGNGGAGAGVAGSGGAAGSPGAGGGAGTAATGGGAGASGGGGAGLGGGGMAGSGAAGRGSGGEVAGATGHDAGAGGQPPGSGSSGCSCRTCGGGAGPLPLALVLVSALAATRRRRRRR